MEDVFPVGQESLEDKHKKNNAGVENDNHRTLSECKLDREHVASKLPLILDIKRPERCRRCCQLHKSCSCTSQFVLSDSFEFSGGTHAADFGLETLRFFCRKSSSLTLPGLKSNSRQQRKSRSIHSVTDLVAECSPVARSGNVVPSPSNRRVFDSIEATLRSRALMKSSVILGTASPDDGMRRVRTKSISLSDTKSPESISFHSGLQNSTSGSPRMVATPCRRRSSELSISQEMPSSCSDTSYQTDSSAGFNSALLHCFWEDGNPYFVFSVGEEDQADVYMASPHKTKSSADKALDYIYLFHAWKKNRKKSEFHLHSGSKFVAKMKVRSSLVLNSSRAKFVESEFVLSAAKEDSFNEMQRSSPCFTKSKGMTGRLSEILRRSHRYKSNSIKRVGGGSSSQVEDLPQRYASELGIIDDIPHNLELAAIVVQDFGCPSKHWASFDGWGLKFLEKAGTDSSRGPPSSSATCKENYTQHMNTGRNVSVLFPAGFHGGPMARAGGPSSLTERWRSNGHCDCGGWDVGCPLTILSNNNSIYSKGLAETEDDCKPLSLFIEGAKQDGLDFSFRMFSMSRDIYIVCFQPTLSALQSFSIGVAMIHSQSSDLCPQWFLLVQSQRSLEQHLLDDFKIQMPSSCNRTIQTCSS